MASVSFSVGDTFSSFKDFESKIEEYQKVKCVQLYRRDSRTIEKSLGRFPNKSFNRDIKYTSISYSCIHGGRNFKSKGNGKRANSTFRMGCPVSIKLKASSDGQKLEVSSLFEEHNHPISYELFANLFHQRRMNETEKENVSNMLKVKANVKIIQTQVMSETGKKVLLKDIHNVKTKNTETDKDMTLLQRAVNTLSEMNGAYVKLITNETNELRGMFFQDKRMRDTFARYPEFLCIDATYKLNDLRMPCYILLVENGNGQSEIVGMWLVSEETEQLISEIVGVFKEQNPKWEDVKVVMSDKDFVERDVFRRLFPETKLKICLFHVLRTFKREITTEKMNITSFQRLSILEILQKIPYSKSYAEYDMHHEILKQTGCEAVISYFDNSWHAIKDEWVTGLSSDYCLGNRTNNRLESINQKLKQVISKHSKLNVFATDFVAFLGTHRTEIDGKLSRAAVKVPVLMSADTDLAQYRRLATQYAFRHIEKQLDRSEKEDTNTYTQENFQYQVAIDKCTCPFYTQFRLPCCHMFALRKLEHESLFDAALVPERWTKAYYLHGMSTTLQPTEVLTSQLPTKAKPKSQQQKYRTAFQICQKLASCVAESTGNEYNVKLNQLQALLESWERGDDVILDIVPGEVLLVQPPTENSTYSMNDPQSNPEPTSEDEEDVIEHVIDAASENSRETSVGLPIPTESTTESPSSPEPSSEDEEDLHVIDAASENSRETSVGLPIPTESTTESPSSPEPSSEDEEDLHFIDAASENSRETSVGLSIPTESTTESPSSPEPRPIPTPTETTIASETPNYPTPTMDITDNDNTLVAQTGGTEHAERARETGACTAYDGTSLSIVTLPAHIRRRGRPKGSDQTVIGLPKKRLKLNKKAKGPQPFDKLADDKKAIVILSWFIDQDLISQHIKDQKTIPEEAIECDPTKVFLGATDVPLHLTKQYLDDDAWSQMEATVRQINQSNRQWACKVCDEELLTRCVGCDSCLNWFHYHCAEIANSPKSQNWFCAECNSGNVTYMKC